MSKDERYRRLLASGRWQRLATEMKHQAGYMCQQCGRVTPRLAVHHIRPVESARTDEEMEALCFRRSNLQVLCYDCHASIHRGSRSKESHRKAEDMRVRRFLERDLRIEGDDGLPFD